MSLSNFGGRRATGAQQRAFADGARNSTWSGQRYGGAEVGINASQMAVLVEATLYRQRVKNGEYVGTQAQTKKRDLIAALNQIDATLGMGGRGRHRPLAYVPYFDSKGALQVPNEFKIAQRYGKRYAKATGHKLISLFGRKHMAILGFVTRNVVNQRSGQLDWTPGGMRAYARRSGGGNRVSTKAIAYYTSAGGKRVTITAKSRSRLAQILVNTGGTAFGGAIPFQWGPAQGARFESPIPNASQPADGERLRTVQSRTGPRYAIVGVMSTGGRSAARIVGLSDANRRALGMAVPNRARSRAASRMASPVGGPAFIDGPGSSNTMSVGSSSGVSTRSQVRRRIESGSGPRVLRPRPNDFEAAQGVAMSN